ncbi:MAG: hypothetical protein ACTSYI_14400 [Promethearchaeota archaeon]
METGVQSKNRSFNVIADYKLSFSLFRENIRPFFIVLLIGFLIYKSLDHLLIKIILPTVLWDKLPFDPEIMLFLLYLPGDSIFFGFFGAVMGLGWDIMSSGDGFTEIRNSLYYIRKYWLKFFFFCFFFNIFSYSLLYLSVGPIYLKTDIILHIVNYTWVLLLSNVFPALVHRNSFIPAIKENFQILIRRFGRVIFTYLPYYCCFVYIRSIMLIYRNHFLHSTSTTYKTITYISFGWEVLYYFIGFPIFAFLSLIMYNDEIRSKEISESAE